MLQGLKPYDVFTLKKSCRACQLLWLPTPTDLIWMTGVAYLTIFGHTCCSVVGHSQSRRWLKEIVERSASRGGMRKLGIYAMILCFGMIK